MYLLQSLVREHIGHACVFIVHDDIVAAVSTLQPWSKEPKCRLARSYPHCTAHVRASRFGTSLAFYRGRKGLSLANPEKKKKRAQKNSKGSRKMAIFQVFLGFWLVFAFFGRVIESKIKSEISTRM